MTSHYNGPPMPARPSGGLASAAGPSQITGEGIEVTQAVQDMSHTVPLVAGKATIVRVYLGTANNTPVTVRGVLRVKSSARGATWQQVTSIRPVLLNPAENGQLRLKRESLDKSLNFILPATATAAGDWTVALGQLQQVIRPGATIPVPAGATRTVKFHETPPLRVRVVGVRYQDSSHGELKTYVPAPKDFVTIRSWLGRAYPVESVVWSQMTVNSSLTWPFDPDPNQAAARVNALIRVLRNQDMASGSDRRTHYFGLVDDAGGLNFMRGLASGVPEAPDPSTVASGPTGVSNFGWDFDGCYGDWYTGHELGHTFGRLHAMFCGAGGGAPYPYPNGQISPNDGSFVGFDFGDAANGLPMKALSGVVWHDVMTYCENQWVSVFTYKGLRDRIVAEAALPAGAAAPGLVGGAAPTAAGGATMNLMSINAVATVNVTKGTAAFQFVTPVASAAAVATPAAANAKYVLRLKKTDGTTLGEYAAPYYPDSCTEPGRDETGLIDATVKPHPEAATLELVHNGKVLASFRAADAPAAPVDVEAEQPAGRTAVTVEAGVAPVVPGDDPVITWRAGVGMGGKFAAHAPALHGPGAAPAPAARHTYTVQLSTDDGHSWTTIGVGLHQPKAQIDRTLLEGVQEVQVRITATDGFRAETTTKTFQAGDL